MARKRKYNQISKKQSVSSSSEKLSEKEEIKHQNKRMKLDNTPDDNKVVFESRRERQISQSKLNKKSSDAFVFSERSSSPNKFIKNSTVDNSIKPLRYKSNEEILELIEIDEVFTESSWSEIEDIQSEIITALSDKFDIIKEESDGNCMFRALSRGWFGTPLCHNKIRESICDYIIKSCSGTCLSLPGDPRMISGFSIIDYPIPSQSPRNTPLIWIRNWLFLFRFSLFL